MVLINNIYLGCALTHVIKERFQEYTETIRIVADRFESEFCAKVHYALEDSDPQLALRPSNERPTLCYLWDKQMVETSDLMLAEVSFPSTGLGQELQIAQSNGIPIILFYKNFQSNIAEAKSYVTKASEDCSLQIGNRIVSIMVQGNPAVISEVQYEDVDTLVTSLIEAANKHFHNTKKEVSDVN